LPDAGGPKPLATFFTVNVNSVSGT